jgi:hypothetical protein
MDSFALRRVRQTPQKRLASASIFFCLLLAACGQAASTPTPDVSKPAWLATAIASGEVRVMTFLPGNYSASCLIGVSRQEQPHQGFFSCRV